MRRLYQFSNVFAGKNFLNFQRIPIVPETFFAMFSTCDLLSRCCPNQHLAEYLTLHGETL